MSAGFYKIFYQKLELYNTSQNIPHKKGNYYAQPFTTKNCLEKESQECYPIKNYNFS